MLQFRPDRITQFTKFCSNFSSSIIMKYILYISFASPSTIRHTKHGAMNGECAWTPQCCRNRKHNKGVLTTHCIIVSIFNISLLKLRRCSCIALQSTPWARGWHFPFIKMHSTNVPSLLFHSVLITKYTLA